MMVEKYDRFIEFIESVLPDVELQPWQKELAKKIFSGDVSIDRSIRSGRSRLNDMINLMTDEMKDDYSACIPIEYRITGNRLGVDGEPKGVVSYVRTTTGKGKGCGQPLGVGQWWSFCGETDMGQTLPALCVDCGGKYKIKDGE